MVNDLNNCLFNDIIILSNEKYCKRFWGTFMSLCSYSSDTHSGSFLVIENTFINEYLPLAPASCVKVYLYGLYLCTNPNSIENTLSNICHILNMDAGEIKDSFEYWQAEGLVQILESPTENELNIKYLPVSKRVGSSKKRADKYSNFNSKIQAVIKGRMITPTEYNEYYTLLESYHFDQDALVLIANYCVKLKGDKVGFPYIITVAKSFHNQGLNTTEAVQLKLTEHEEITPEINELLKCLGKKTAITLEDRNNYIKWTKEFGYTIGVIKEVAKSLKGKPNASLFKLDNLLSSYFKLKLFTTKDIVEYNTNREKYLELAKDVTHTLGLYYDNLDTIIENYITDWLQKGYDEDTIRTIAHYSLKRSTRTIEGMNNVIQKFYKLGLISKESINQYIDEVVSIDQEIQEVLDKCNLLRSVNVYDRNAYQTWTNTWNISKDIILYVADLSKDKNQPMQYMNKILSNLYEEKIANLEDAKKYLSNSQAMKSTGSSNKKAKRPSTERVLEQKDFDALFSNLDNIEI